MVGPTHMVESKGSRFFGIVCFALFILVMFSLVVGSVYIVHKGDKKNGTFSDPIKMAIATMTNSYEEIGWREVVATREDEFSGCAYFIVKMNDKFDDTKFLRRCWFGPTHAYGASAFDEFTREVEKDGKRVLQTYVVIATYADDPTLVALRNAKFTRSDR